MSSEHLDVPNFSRKLSWAERRLEELEVSIAAFRDRHPYETRQRVPNDPKSPWVIVFTEDANPDWALMVGEILYNLRATLDYLAVALNPRSRRRDVMFPIMREKVWEIPFVEGENTSLTEAREKWETCTRRMNPRAVELIKALQPVDPERYEPEFHHLDILNRLSNEDRHRNLHVHISGLTNTIVWHWITEGNGSEVSVLKSEGLMPHPSGKGTTAIRHNTSITPPDGVSWESVIKVKCVGTTTQAIQIAEDDDRHVEVPLFCRQLLVWIRERAVVPLAPYLHHSST